MNYESTRPKDLPEAIKPAYLPENNQKLMDFLKENESHHDGDTVRAEPSESTLFRRHDASRVYNNAQWEKLMLAVNEANGDGAIRVFKVRWKKPDGTFTEEHITIAPSEDRELHYEIDDFPSPETTFIYVKKWEIAANVHQPRFALDRLGKNVDSNPMYRKNCLMQEHGKYMNRTNTIHLSETSTQKGLELLEKGYERISIQEFETRIFHSPDHPDMINDLELIASVFRLKLMLFKHSSQPVDPRIYENLEHPLPFTTAEAMSSSKWFDVKKSSKEALGYVVAPRIVPVEDEHGKTKYFDLPHEVVNVVVLKNGNLLFNIEISPQSLNQSQILGSGGSISVHVNEQNQVLNDLSNVIANAERCALDEAEQELGVTADPETIEEVVEPHLDEKTLKVKVRIVKRPRKNVVRLASGHASDRVVNTQQIVLIRNARRLTATEQARADLGKNEQHEVRQIELTPDQVRWMIENDKILDTRTIASFYMYLLFLEIEKREDYEKYLKTVKSSLNTAIPSHLSIVNR